jgi:hypothetical protein
MQHLQIRNVTGQCTQTYSVNLNPVATMQSLYLCTCVQEEDVDVEPLLPVRLPPTDSENTVLSSSLPPSPLSTRYKTYRRKTSCHITSLATKRTQLENVPAPKLYKYKTNQATKRPVQENVPSGTFWKVLWR